MIEVVLTFSGASRVVRQSFGSAREANGWARLWAPEAQRVEMRPFEDRRSRPRMSMTYCGQENCPYCEVTQ